MKILPFKIATRGIKYKEGPLREERHDWIQRQIDSRLLTFTLTSMLIALLLSMETNNERFDQKHE